MQRKLVILFILLILLFLPPLYKLTAKLIDLAALYLSWKNKTDVCARLVVPSFAYPGETFSGYLICENCGTHEGTGYGEVIISDENTNLIYFLQTTGLYRLKPGEEFSMNFSTSLKEGIYKVIGRCFVETTLTETYRKIVIARPPKPPPPPITVPPKPPFYNLTLKYEKELNLTQAEEYLFIIYVKNSGDSTIHNLTIVPLPGNISMKIIYPLQILLLQPKSEVMFITKIKVPGELKEGTYYLRFNVTSKEIWREGRVKIYVKSLEERELVLSLIKKYEKVLEQTSKEIEKLKAEGKNTTLAEEYQKAVEKKLGEAKELYRLELYKEAKKKLDEVGDLVEKLVIEIARLKRIKLPVKIPAYLPVWILLLLVICLLIAVIALLIKRKYIYAIRLRRFV